MKTVIATALLAFSTLSFASEISSQSLDSIPVDTQIKLKKDFIIPAGSKSAALFSTTVKAEGYKKIVMNCSLALRKSSLRTRKFSANSIFVVKQMPDHNSRNYTMIVSEDDKSYELACNRKGYHKFGETWLEMTVGDFEEGLKDIAQVEASPIEEVR